jgi:alanine dehydrogenase
MEIGVPKESRPDEYRVGLIPAGVELLVEGGHTCFVEHDAGRGAGFSDVDYESVGARIVYSAQELYGRSGAVVKVGRPTADEIKWLREGSVLCGFLHLAVSHREHVEALLAKKITAIAYEMIQTDEGVLPVQLPLSQAAGRMAPQVAATFMQNHHGGKGILLGGVPGVPPAEVVIIGAGAFGAAAAHAFLRHGASVYVLDKDLARLQMLEEEHGMSGRLVTMVSYPFNLRKVVKFADVVVGAVLIPGMRAPIVVTREMVRLMKPRSVILDISIDQGGCIETSRPTTHRDPTFTEEGIIHYCVPNMTSVVARTATHAFNNAVWPYIQAIAEKGLDAAIDEMKPLSRGVTTRDGKLVKASLAAHLGPREELR